MRKHIFVALLILFFCSLVSAQTQIQELYINGDSLSAGIASNNAAIGFGASIATQGANGNFGSLNVNGIANNATMAFNGLAQTSTDTWVGQMNLVGNNSLTAQDVALQSVASVFGTGAANAGGTLAATAFSMGQDGLNASGVFVGNQVVVINFGPGIATGVTSTGGQSN